MAEQDRGDLGMHEECVYKGVGEVIEVVVFYTMRRKTS